MPMGLSVAAAAPVKALAVLVGLDGVFVGLPPLPPLPPLPLDVGRVPLLGGAGAPVPEPEPGAVVEEVGQKVVVKVLVRVMEPVVMTVVPVDVVVVEDEGEVVGEEVEVEGPVLEEEEAVKVGVQFGRVVWVAA